MRISRRTSGGRGEYEVSERHGALTPRSLEGLRLVLELQTGWKIDTGVVVRSQGGKHRLRIDGAQIHLHRQLSAALLMPRPVRADEGLGSGQPILKSDRYAVEHIDLRYVDPRGDHALLRIAEVELRNFNLHAELLRFDERVADVAAIWERAEELPAEVAGLLQRHQRLATTGGPVPRSTEQVIATLQETLTDLGADFGIHRQGGEDLLPDLKKTLDLAAELPAPDVDVEEVDPNELELKRRVIRDWRRWAANRGAPSARFRHRVREAYRWTCLVCGGHYPRTSYNRVAGVDAAHILPWAEYDLDEVTNGLCLCKQHHWAFDEGLLSIAADGDQYLIRVFPDIIEAVQEEAPSFTLDDLLAHEGPVPADRLPEDRSLWPNAHLLRTWYESYHAS